MVSTTTVQSLKENLKTVLRNITPSYEKQRSFIWDYSETFGEEEAPSTRRYTLWIDASNGTGDENAFFDQQGKIMPGIINIQTSYCEFDQYEIDAVCSQDHDDILEALENNLDPTIPGLWSVELGESDLYSYEEDFNHEDERTIYQVTHYFTIGFYKRR